MVCGDLTDRFEVATELIQLLGLKDDIEIIKVNSDYFSKEYFAERPDCERLINKKLDDLNLNIMRPWKVALKEYIDNYYFGYIS